VVQVHVERYFSRGALRHQRQGFFVRRRTSEAVRPPENAATLAVEDRDVARGGAVTIQGVSKSFASLRVLDDVSLDVPAGSVTVILGPSGAGKSTLLRTINHLERVDAGFIAVDGELLGYRREGEKLYELHEPEIRRRRADIGMVFQTFNLFPPSQRA
jgi:polar amino acid transport system permease protein